MIVVLLVQVAHALITPLRIKLTPLLQFLRLAALDLPLLASDVILDEAGDAASLLYGSFSARSGPH